MLAAGQLRSTHLSECVDGSVMQPIKAALHVLHEREVQEPSMVDELLEEGHHHVEHGDEELARCIWDRDLGATRNPESVDNFQAEVLHVLRILGNTTGVDAHIVCVVDGGKGMPDSRVVAAGVHDVLWSFSALEELHHVLDRHSFVIEGAQEC